MQSLPDLSQLSHAQKDELIIALFGQVQELMKRIDGMQKAIDDLQGRLSLNSKNSSKPPSSDGLNKPKPKSLRVGGQRPTGGQKGHPGGTLRQVAKPDTVITHDVPDQCQACQQRLGVAYVGEVRQVFDLPTLKYQVTEHRVMQALCRCGHMHTGQFPSGRQCQRAIRAPGACGNGASEPTPDGARGTHSSTHGGLLWLGRI